MHPLGYGDIDQIDPAVAAALTTSQVEWLFRQCQELSLKKLQILRQALLSGSMNIRITVLCQHFWVRDARCPRELYESTSGGIHVSQGVRNFTGWVSGIVFQMTFTNVSSSC